jgi:uncharacterized membrane protein
MMQLLAALIFVSASSMSASAAENVCANIDWLKVQQTWNRYEKEPSGQLEKELLTLLPVEQEGTDGCPSYDGAYAAMSKHFKSLQKRVATGAKSPLCLTFRLQALASGAFARDLETLSNEGLRRQKGMDQLAFQNACQAQRKAANPANFKEKFTKESMTPTEKECEAELERFMSFKKKWKEAVTDAESKKKCLAVLKKVAPSSQKTALCSGISELLMTERKSIESKCAKLED